MAVLRKEQREALVAEHARALALVYFGELLRSNDYEQVIAALDGYCHEHRRSPVVRWIRFQALDWKTSCYWQMGRLEDALAACSRMSALPATETHRATFALTHAAVLAAAGRAEDAFQCAMKGLRHCSRTNSVEASCGLIREIVQLECPEYLEQLAGEYPKLILSAAGLRGFVPMVQGEPRSPREVLEALQEGIRRDIDRSATS